ncbi:MAG: TniQ family protein [Rhodospirillales bacterium]|nr:TniQ family protein [Rhodospirillales bacterium]
MPDESFSSWFACTAVANGLRPGELYRIVQAGEDRNPRDLDRYADDHLIHRLADCTGIDVDRLWRATFRRWEGLLFDHDYGDRKLAWLPPAGRVNGKRCFGQQACPMCLWGGHEPYLRQI